MATANSSTGASADEQSMEEILQSIRRIIAEEDEQQAPTPAAASTPGEDDVLELTEPLEEAESDFPAGDASGTDPLATIDAIMAGEEKKAAPEPEPAPQEVAPIEVPSGGFVAPAEPVADAGDFVSENTLNQGANALRAMRENLQRQNAPARQAPNLVFRSGTTVEDLIVEALRPLLKEWMDAHLPETVERIVQREIQRMVQNSSF